MKTFDQAKTQDTESLSTGFEFPDGGQVVKSQLALLNQMTSSKFVKKPKFDFSDVGILSKKEN